MKFTLSWLKDHLDTDAGLDAIVETLIAIGLEVDSIDDPGAKLAAFRVAHVIAAPDNFRPSSALFHSAASRLPLFLRAVIALSFPWSGLGAVPKSPEVARGGK